MLDPILNWCSSVEGGEGICKPLWKRKECMKRGWSYVDGYPLSLNGLCVLCVCQHGVCVCTVCVCALCVCAWCVCSVCVWARCVCVCTRCVCSVCVLCGLRIFIHDLLKLENKIFSMNFALFQAFQSSDIALSSLGQLYTLIL